MRTLCTEEGGTPMAIATLSKEEQETLIEHGSFKHLRLVSYDDESSIVVECSKCNSILVELVGGREDDVAHPEPQITREFIERVLEKNNALCMDVKAERRLLAMKLVNAIKKELSK